MSYGRTRKQVKLDKKQKYNELAGHRAEESTREAFHRKPYAIGHKAETGKKTVIGYDSVADFYEARLKGGGAGGNDKGTVSIVQEQPTRNR